MTEILGSNNGSVAMDTIKKYEPISADEGNSKLVTDSKWSTDDQTLLVDFAQESNEQWEMVSSLFNRRFTPEECRNRFKLITRPAADKRKREESDVDVETPVPVKHTEIRLLSERQQLAYLLKSTGPKPLAESDQEDKDGDLSALSSSEGEEKRMKKAKSSKKKTAVRKSMASVPDEYTPPVLSSKDRPADYLEWSSAKRKAWEQIEKNPNAYYYRHTAPGEKQNNGKWAKDEHASFMQALRKHPPNGHWGLFAMYIPGRVGYQCRNYYHHLLSTGVLKDSDYMDDSGKYTPKKVRGGKKSSSSSKAARTPIKKGSKKAKVSVDEEEEQSAQSTHDEGESESGDDSDRSVESSRKVNVPTTLASAKSLQLSTPTKTQANYVTTASVATSSFASAATSFPLKLDPVVTQQLAFPPSPPQTTRILQKHSPVRSPLTPQRTPQRVLTAAPAKSRSPETASAISVPTIPRTVGSIDTILAAARRLEDLPQMQSTALKYLTVATSEAVETSTLPPVVRPLRMHEYQFVDGKLRSLLPNPIMCTVEQGKEAMDLQDKFDVQRARVDLLLRSERERTTGSQPSLFDSCCKFLGPAQLNKRPAAPIVAPRKRERLLIQDQVDLQKMESEALVAMHRWQTAGSSNMQYFA